MDSGRQVICLIANPNSPRGEQSSGLPDSLGVGEQAGVGQGILQLSYQGALAAREDQG